MSLNKETKPNQTTTDAIGSGSRFIVFNISTLEVLILIIFFPLSRTQSLFTVIKVNAVKMYELHRSRNYIRFLFLSVDANLLRGVEVVF